MKINCSPSILSYQQEKSTYIIEEIKKKGKKEMHIDDLDEVLECLFALGFSICLEPVTDEIISISFCT